MKSPSWLLLRMTIPLSKNGQLLGGAEVTPYSTVDSGTGLSLQERCHVVLDPQLGTSVDHQLFDAVHGRNTERRIYVYAWDPSV